MNSQKTESIKLMELLRSNKQQLDRIVLDFLPIKSSTSEISQLYEMMRDYPSRGGKGLRGTACLLWCELFGGNRADALVTAAALELFQNWILIHDDIEDQSDLRRGQPALHRKVGVELAINAGDALHGKMWELLLRNRNRLSSLVTLNILTEFAMMINATTEGQQMELSWCKQNRWEISEADYFEMVTKKSAWYTCITPARLGVLIAAEKNEQVRSHDFNRLLDDIVNFGTKLGVSFQIIDDVLNLMGDESKYGKEIFGDIFEGKRTLMLIHLLSESSTAHKRKIIQMISRPRAKKTLDEVRSVYDEMKDCGSLKYATNSARKLSEQALSQYDSVCSKYGIRTSRCYRVVRSLVEYLTSRDY